jgi:hypothetical protein
MSPCHQQLHSLTHTYTPTQTLNNMFTEHFHITFRFSGNDNKIVFVTFNRDYYIIKKMLNTLDKNV